MSVIQMNLTSVLSVPLQNYAKDFSFIVNGEEIKTSSIVSDIISPNICKIHSLDPTVNTFIINTKHSGDFSHVIKLVNFNSKDTPDSWLCLDFKNNKIIPTDYTIRSGDLSISK